MSQAKLNRSNKPKPEPNRPARDATESHLQRWFAWNPFSWKLKRTCFIPFWRKWRKSEKRSSSLATPELPPEIIMEILIRLPIKSIGRSRCVSKLFRSLSSHPGFAISHLDLTLPPVHQKLIVSSHRTYTLELYSIIGGGEVTQDRNRLNVELIHPRKAMNTHLIGESFYLIIESDKRDCVEIYGSSNGLVCVSPYEDVVLLYNPTTRESKLLPESTVTVPSRFREKYQSYGFGFDHLTNDYKVVKLVANSNNLLYACVYSLKSNSWRWIRDLNYQYIDRYLRPGVNLNGVIHWVFARLQECDHKKRRVILAFDIVTEEFRELPFPDEEEAEEECGDSYLKDFSVGKLNGRLCVFYNCWRELLHDDIWVMDEFGVASSWRRVRISLLYKLMKPVCSTKNGEEVLMALDGDMVLYNFETDAWRKIEGVGLNQGCDANIYVESLESPNLYGFE